MFDRIEPARADLRQTGGHMPRLIIGLPVFNGERYLAEALQAFIDQTFTDWEIFILDNASEDETEAIAKKFAQRDKRIHYYRHVHNLGAAENFNRCFQFASGEFFKWAAHDDICGPTYLERCIATLDREPGSVLCHSRVRFVDQDANIIGDYTSEDDAFVSPDPVHRLKEVISFRHFCVSVFGVIRTENLRQTPLIGKYVGSDRNLLADLALAGKLAQVPEPLFLSRQHKGRSTNILPRRERAVWFDTSSKRFTILLYSRNFFEYLKSIARSPLRLHQKCKAAGCLFVWAARNHRMFLSDLYAALTFWHRSPNRKT